jgi:hypothetical protein
MVGQQTSADTEASQTDGADAGSFGLAVEVEAPDERLLACARAASFGDTHRPRAIAVVTDA